MLFPYCLTDSTSTTFVNWPGFEPRSAEASFFFIIIIIIGLVLVKKERVTVELSTPTRQRANQLRDDELMYGSLLSYIQDWFSRAWKCCLQNRPLSSLYIEDQQLLDLYICITNSISFGQQGASSHFYF